MHSHTASTVSPLRYALRSLGKSPGFVAAAVVSLGLALALNTTTFALVDAVRHPPMPYADPERIAIAIFFGGGKEAPVLPEERLRAVRDGFRGYEKFSSYTFMPAVVQTSTAVENQLVVGVDSGFFELLGVRPMVGRTVAMDGEQTAVISHSLWQRLFNGRPLSPATQIGVGLGRYTVVGVMPRGMHFPVGAEVWLARPSIVADTTMQKFGPFPLLRLRRDVTLQAARTELDVIATRLTMANAKRFGLAARLSVVGSRTGYRQPFPSIITITVLVVLIIACANLGAMMLARGIARRRETAIRIALGASRRAVVRHVLTECGVLVTAGSAVGVLLTFWSLHILPHVVAPYVPQIGDIEPTPSWRVFAFVLVVAAAMILAAGLLPSLRAASTDPAEPMKDGSGTITSRLRDRYNPLVVVEVALSTALLMACGMFAIYVIKLSSFEFRFAAKRLVTATLDVRKHIAPDSASVERFYQDLVRRARDLPGAQSVATRYSARPSGAQVLSEQGRSGEKWMNLDYYTVVSPEYLRTLGISVSRGRDFVTADQATEAGVVIVDDSTISRLWPDVPSPVGHMIKLGRKESNAPWLRVVGVARSVYFRPRNDGDALPDPTIYVVLPHDQSRWREVVVRADDDGSGRGREKLQLALQREIASFAPRMGSVLVRPMLQEYEQTQTASEMMAYVFAALGAFGLTLCAVGLYGILAYSVRRRLREYAVRIALGARSADVVRLVMHDVAVTALAGIGIGAFIALWLTHQLSDAVHSVAYADAIALVCAELVLLLVAAASCLGPLRQATSADPVEVLRAS